MSILSDKDIKKYLREKKLVVEPLEDPDDQIQSAWIDLRLGNEFRVFRVIGTPYLDPKIHIDSYTELIRITDRPFILHPGEFVLGRTKERIKLPDDIAACIDGRSSLGRLGVVIHVTSGWVDPGWDGILTLEITNVGKMPIALYPEMKVCKLILTKLSSPSERPYNKRKNAKYQKQEGIEESKIFEDFLR